MSGWLLLGAYAAIIAPAFAILAWGLLRRFGRLGPRPAALAAMVTWLVLAGAPIAGLAVDRIRDDDACSVAGECYEHFFAAAGVPAGWLLATVVLAGALCIGRTPGRDVS